MRKDSFITKKIFIIPLALFLMIMTASVAFAATLFGPPQTISREAGGLNTSIGYWYGETRLNNNAEYIFRQNKVYSQVSYGRSNLWEIYGRIGVTDLRISDAFNSTNVATITHNNDFTENWKFFGTLGAKGFLPFNKIWGIGAFLQGTYYFNNFTGDVTGTSAGVPFAADLKVRDMWDVNFGLGIQATLPRNIKLYAGPFVGYSEANLNLSANISGLSLGTTDTLLKSKAFAGGFAGADIPLGKGFHLNIEGQYFERFSGGAAISYRY